MAQRPQAEGASASSQSAKGPARGAAKDGGKSVAKGTDAAGLPGKATIIRRRRSRRSNRLDPEAGWSLVGDAAGRLGLWEGLLGFLAVRAFALAIKQLVPRLSSHARAEQLQGDTLVVRVSSSAVASELSFVRDPVLSRVNEELERMVARTRRTGPARKLRITRLQHRVGKVAELPDALAWSSAGNGRPPRPRPARPRPQVDSQVAAALGQVHDESLRRALSAMYAASLQEPEPRKPAPAR